MNSGTTKDDNQKHIMYSIVDGVMQIGINRPEKKNALSQAMYCSLTHAIKLAVSDDSVRVIILSGHGGEFTSGNDLADFADAANLDSGDNPTTVFLRTFTNCPKPIVVAVDGVAIGIGTTLLMHSDFVYASTNSRFKLPFVSLGLCPEYASSLILPRLMGHVKAAEWLLLGDDILPNDAMVAGLINAVVEDPLAKAQEIAKRLALQAPSAVRTAKALMKRATKVDVDDAIMAEIVEFSRSLKGPEFSEAVSAFFEKRSPDFSNLK